MNITSQIILPMRYIFLSAISICLLNLSIQAQGTLPEYAILYNVHYKDSTAGNWEIMYMAPDGSKKQNITNDPATDWTYLTHHDSLFFISDRDTCARCFFLYVSDALGVNLRKVSDLMLEDSWMDISADGKTCLVSGRTATERFQLYAIQVQNGTYTKLTYDTAALYSDPCFSPDGKQIVFSYKKNRRDKNSHEELFIMNADGSNALQLTQYPENNPSAKEYGYKAGAPRWHPTENFITYISKQDGRHSIFAITPDGQKQWKLLDNAASDGWHDWCPDGKWLVYNGSDNAEDQFHIYLMQWPDGKIMQLTDSTLQSQLAPVFIEKKK